MVRTLPKSRFPAKVHPCKKAFQRIEVRPAMISLVHSYLKEIYTNLLNCMKRKVIQKKKLESFILEIHKMG